MVDNNSTDDIQAVCDRFPNVRYTRERKPGNNAARNQGIAIAQGEVIAITDADCIPCHNWLAEGVRSLLAYPGAGIIGGHIEFFFQGDRPSVVEYADSVLYLQQQLYVERDHYAAGANLFIRREVIETVGWFEERLLNLGDKEFGQRVYAAGWDVRYAPAAIVWHPARASLAALVSKAQRQARAYHRLCEITGRSQPKRAVLSINWPFLKTVLGDENLPSWGEKLGFVWIVWQMKRAILKINFCSDLRG